jgi:indolepyruvate ferredoxin oxidoreductase
MGAPALPNADVTLDDRYDLERSRVLMNGTQALVRLTLEQAGLDRAAGLNTAGYVTGYRGSPLGGVDTAFGAARAFTEQAGIRFHPGVNEDLAATAIIGTQQIALNGQARKDGVFALWYGKGPGVDRSGDPFHHGNAYGSAPLGGVLIAAGDDHLAKSSTTAHQSEYALMHAMIPVLHPAALEEIVGFGLAGWAMSRFSGCWAGLKLVTDLVDSSGTVDLSGLPRSFLLPDVEFPPGGLNIRAPDTPQDQERRLHQFKLPAAQAFARANGLDRITHDAPSVLLGIVTTGKSWRDTCQALGDLGIGPVEAQRLGIAIYKVGLVWPLEPVGIAAFSSRAEELLVIEEKRPLIEDQLRAILYDRPTRPRIYGKQDAENRQLLPSFGDLGALDIARAIAARILPRVEDKGLLDRIAALSAIDPVRLASLAPVRRTPYFCSGCPHNSSTVVPDGSRAIAGIGCHGMVQMMDRATDVFVQMGGEGANWIGQAPFVETPHVFQNLGDGTYFHSGLLAVRAAVAAGVNITYKILFNDAVAMTGGQPHDGQLTPQAISRQLRAEGVKRIAVVSDDPGKYRDQPPFVEGATIHHRRDLDAVQRELRETPGVTGLIYDQMCATEKRRRRKRGKLPQAERRVLINDLVCEGCGDCSVKSNCLSVVPLETEFGRKRAIDQSSCNQDLSCLNGFCPSFVTVTGATLRKGRATDTGALDGIDLPDPPQAAPSADIMVTGIGGTGVVTIGAVLAMAAHLEGKAARTLDQTGLAQKGGQVITHLKISDQPIASEKLSPASATLLLGADLVSSASKDVLSVLRHGTRVVLNREETMTGAFVRQPDFQLGGARLARIVSDIAGEENVARVDATVLARRLLGDAIGANMILVGYAWQQGAIPLSEAAILRALELNGTAVAMNQAAFRIGRILAAKPDALLAVAPDTASTARDQLRLSESLDELVERRVRFLTDYQDAAYADGYRTFVDQVRARERAAIGREGDLSEAVARGLFRLMAYKDEYEVARLYSGAAFREQLDRSFEQFGRVEFHLAPPLVARRDKLTGEPRKMRFGPWVRHAYRVLAAGRRLRGTWLDLFGYTGERRMERALIGEYRAMIERELEALSPLTYSRAVKIAAAAERIRGYGHIKARNLAEVRREWSELEARTSQPEMAAA